MQTSKFLTALCTAACCTAMISLHAQDNPAQAAAMAALMQQMNAGPAPAAPPVKTAPVVVAPVITPAPEQAASVQPAPDVTTGTGTDSADNPAQAAAMAALMQQMNAEPAPATPPMKTTPVVVVPVTTPAPAPAQMATTTMATQSATMPSMSQKLEYKPIVAPPLPISMSQQQQLQALNAKYIANQIAPEDYFKQRAAILAQQ